MRNTLNKFTQNTIRLAALERVSQLERLTPDMHIIEKQVDLGEVASQIIIRANSLPGGEVTVVFTDKKFDNDTPIERILLNSMTKISGFNVRDPESLKSPYRSMIIVDPEWSDNFEIYGSQYGLPLSFLQKL